MPKLDQEETSNQQQ